MSVNTDSFFNFLGITKKAGKLLFGFSAAESSIKYKLAKLILIASDLSGNTFKKLEKIFKKNVNSDLLVSKIKIKKELIKKTFSKETGILIITDENFASKTLSIMEEELLVLKN